MKRGDAIKIIMTALSCKDIVVSTTGLISREIFEKFDSARNAYVPGSMGLASSIGLGLAISLPKEKIVVVDGDASLLMNLGSMVTIGNKQPVNLLHIVIDNGAYGSCSEERSMSDSAHLDLLAQNVGYRYVRVVSSQSELERVIISFRNGPGFILAKVKLGGCRDFLRPLDLPGIKDRFLLSFVKPQKGEKL